MGHFKLTGPGTDGLYKYGGATIELSGFGRRWHATARFKRQEKDFEGASSDEALEAAMAWVDAAPEHPRDFHGRPRPLGESRHYPKPPEPTRHFVSPRVAERNGPFESGFSEAVRLWKSGVTWESISHDPRYDTSPFGRGMYAAIEAMSGWYDDAEREARAHGLSREEATQLAHSIGDPSSPNKLRETNGHRVADFNTLDDLIAHARGEGATHLVSLLIRGTGKGETKLYFPRSDGAYDEANVRSEGGYWHAEGPRARKRVARLPDDAVPIEEYGGGRGGRRSFGYTDQRTVRDYIAVDPRDRQVAGPFKSYGDARKEADNAGGVVKFVPSKPRVGESPRRSAHHRPRSRTRR